MYIPYPAPPDFVAIIGGIVGGVLVLVCLIVIVVIAMFLLKRHKSDKFRENLVEMSGLVERERERERV